MKRFNKSDNNSNSSRFPFINANIWRSRLFAVNKRVCIRVLFICIVLYALLSITRQFFHQTVHINMMRKRPVTSRSGLKAEGNQFTLDDKPFTILSGAIHYFRVVPEYWEDRLRKLKAIGLNTVET